MNYIKNKYRIGKLLDNEFGKYIGYDKDYLEVIDNILSYLDPKLEKCYTCNRLVSELRECSKEGCNRKLCCTKKCTGRFCNYGDIIYCEEHISDYTREFIRETHRIRPIRCKLCLCKEEQRILLNGWVRRIISEERMNELCEELGILNMSELRLRRDRNRIMIEERRDARRDARRREANERNRILREAILRVENENEINRRREENERIIRLRTENERNRRIVEERRRWREEAIHLEERREARTIDERTYNALHFFSQIGT